MTRAIEAQEQTTFRSNQSCSRIQGEAQELFKPLPSDRGAAQQAQPKELSFSDIYGGSDVLGGKNGATACETAKAFKPDSFLFSRGAREWNNSSQEQRQKGIQLDSEGKYQVQKGDSVWTLAERMSRGADGKKPSNAQVLESMKKLVEANPELECNPNFLKQGAKLNIPGSNGGGELLKSDSKAQQSGPAVENRIGNFEQLFDSNSRSYDEDLYGRTKILTDGVGLKNYHLLRK